MHGGVVFSWAQRKGLPWASLLWISALTVYSLPRARGYHSDQAKGKDALQRLSSRQPKFPENLISMTPPKCWSRAGASSPDIHRFEAVHTESRSAPRHATARPTRTR
ncbi:hypothetical protein FA13DRAFT_1739966 [Coprinellus micaceus]|uniref:Uncharacterized protein n=1 Tax=Coprinellus micaceus TaxID=71717 RepID=A0A4Y7SNN7_COPMI|nr:hypothetical protein FA13DRAFT_1739966 [Coprinellus micaceus]